MAKFEDLIGSAQLPEDSAPICLRGSLQRRHDDLERQLREAADVDRADDSLAGGGTARKIAEQIRAVEADMREHTHPFGFRALPSKGYRDLVEAHPPRKDNETDAAFGANMSTFPFELISACCIDPVMTVEQVAQLAELLTEGQLMTMFTCAAALNRVLVDVPKSELASEILANFALNSKPRAPGASRGAGSSAGSLAG